MKEIVLKPQQIFSIKIECAYLLFGAGKNVHITKDARKQAIKPIVGTRMQISKQLHRWTCLRKCISNFFLLSLHASRIVCEVTLPLNTTYKHIRSFIHTHFRTHSFISTSTSTTTMMWWWWLKSWRWWQICSTIIWFSANFLYSIHHIWNLLNFPFNICANKPFSYILSCGFSSSRNILCNEPVGVNSFVHLFKWNL